ncbi:sialic acid-binding Ig-like lectin 5 isoform X2 [Genypterus blacodes]|uniref:sialic acid-binding Ig-like lectin 5 isoform X2 n=1 Tax=Genypterus blacodes TaxID=154954 RepID=UPI003F76371D
MFVLIWATLLFSVRGNNTATDLTQKPTLMVPALIEGQNTTLTCTAPGRCSGSAPNITWMWREKGQNTSYVARKSIDYTTKNLTRVTQRHSSTLTFSPTVKHHGTEVTCKVKFKGGVTTEETLTLNVSYMTKPEISGKCAVEVGDVLNLTCSVHSFPPSVSSPYVTWTKPDGSRNLENQTNPEMQNGVTRATLVIFNVTAADSGRYICTAKHLNKTMMETADIRLMSYPNILNVSVCVLRSELLTCVCISEGVPLPSITWPLFENHTAITTEYSLTVNSTIIVPVKDGSNATAECVSRNKFGGVKRNLNIIKDNLGQEDVLKGLLRTLIKMEVVIAFFSGALLGAAICCLAKICRRKKQKSTVNLAGTLELVTSEDNRLINDDQGAENNQIHKEEADEGGADSDSRPNDVEYAAIEFSLLKRESPSEAAMKQEATESEYAEIKTNQIQPSGEGEQGQVLDAEEEEEDEIMIEEDEEMKDCKPEEDEDEERPVYPNVKDNIGED